MKKGRTSFLNRHFALIIALMFGAMAAILVFVLPQWRFDKLLNLIGINRFFPGVSPPYLMNARLAATAAGALFTCSMTWPVLRFIEPLMGKKSTKKPGQRTVAADKRRESVSHAPVSRVRTTDYHPDAPPRRPIFAETELGAPLMSDDALASDGELILGERDQALPVSELVASETPGPIESLPDLAAREPVVRGSLFSGITDKPVETDTSYQRQSAPTPIVRESLFSNTQPAAPIQMTAQTVVEPEAALAEPEHLTKRPPEKAAVYAIVPPAPGHSAPVIETPIPALIDRLEAALQLRAERQHGDSGVSAATDGDIASLRQTLRSFGGAA